MMIELLKAHKLWLTLDPVDTEDRVLSVAFDVNAEMHFAFQNVRIEIKECWFEYSALNDFEKQVRDLARDDATRATLIDMSNKPIFQILKEGNRVKFIIEASDDSVAMGKGSIEVAGYASEVEELLARLRDYPKWW